jgi:hypothetical protein
MSTANMCLKEADINDKMLDATINYLKNENMISEEFTVTELGYKAMEPYKVDNAIIMAAGISSRCLPFSKIIPKGLFKIKDEILIERNNNHSLFLAQKYLYLLSRYLLSLKCIFRL